VATKITTIFHYFTQPEASTLIGSKSGGWSESTWINTDNLALDSTVLRRMHDARSSLMPQGSSIVGVRLSQYELSGNRLIRKGARSADRNQPGSARLQQDIPQMALQINVSAIGKINTSKLTLCALPDARVVGGEYSPTNDFNTAVFQYTSTLTALTAGFIGVDHTQFVSVISGINNGIVTTDEALPNVVVGSYIRINRVTTNVNQPLSGSFRVSAINGSSYTCPDLALYSADRGGTAMRDVVVFCAYNEYVVKGVRVRKIGRPLSGYRGRSTR